MHYSIRMFFFCYSLLFFNPAFSEELINITGIYQNNNGNSDYITINRQGNTYIIINITKGNNLLKALQLIYEVDTQARPIEDFAFTFISEVKYLLRGPGYISSLNPLIDLNSLTMIAFYLDESNTINLDLLYESGILFNTDISYKKIF